MAQLKNQTSKERPNGFIAFLFICLLAGEAGGTGYYVKTNGLNTAAGTNWNTAWRTITYAASNIGAGDAVIVSNGTYSGQVTVINSGTPGNDILFRAYRQGQAVVKGGNSCFLINNRDHIHIEGFVIQEAAAYGLLVQGDALSNHISRNSIWSNRQYGICFTSGNIRGNSIISNDIRKNGSSGIGLLNGDINIIRDNLLHHNRTNGIYLAGSASLNFAVRNEIYSNALAGLMIDSETADSNYIAQNNVYGATQVYGIRILNSDNNHLKTNHIHNNRSAGLVIDYNSHNNKITRNRMAGNAGVGLGIDGNFNSIGFNQMKGPNQQYGISTTYGDNNVYRSNRIIQNTIYGIDMTISDTMTNNYFIRNEISSNNWCGIYNNSFNGSHNYFISNNFHSQGRALYMGNNDNNFMTANLIHHHSYCGILIAGSADSHYMGRNIIYSNEQYGIYLYANISPFIISNEIYGLNQDYGIYGTGPAMAVDSAQIKNNRIHDNGGYGIYITNAANSLIYRNLMYNNTGAHVVFTGPSANNRLINNTIYHSLSSNGVQWQDSSAGSLYNNIFLSNGSRPNHYAVRNTGSGTVRLGYNIFYGDSAGPTNGLFSWGKGNLFKDPRLDTRTSFTLLSSQSHAVDTGTNISGLSDIFNGTGPDMGWKESGFSYTLLYWKWATAVSTNQIDLAWEDLPNETGYTLYRSTSSQTNSSLRIASLAANQTNYSDTGLLPGTFYYYWLKTYTNTYSSPYSSVIFTITFPPAPQWISALALSPEEVSLLWKNILNETHYGLYRHTEENPAAALLAADLSAEQTNCLDTGLKPATRYYYWLKAYNTSGGSVFSESISVLLPESSLVFHDLKATAIAPNPFQPRSGKQIDYVMFYHLTPEFEVSIFTLTGIKVAGYKARSRDGRYKWGVRDSRGKALRSGTYICYFTNPGKQEKYLKLVIIR
ncbi:MAG: right-handed parallel beta-helix repeat-containing protein [bacterium]|nr:right-handed parallel beta-helix repeat-containing protein [bacterium]